MSNINNNTTNLENILDTIDDIAGSPILLWTNPSPTSSFAAQTITVASGYDAYLVEIAYGGGYYDKRTISYLPLNTSNVVLAGSFLFKANTNVAGYRLISSASNDKIVFSYGSDTANARNDNLGIPTRIWGVKFTL